MLLAAVCYMWQSQHVAMAHHWCCSMVCMHRWHAEQPERRVAAAQQHARRALDTQVPCNCGARTAFSAVLQAGGSVNAACLFQAAACRLTAAVVRSGWREPVSTSYLFIWMLCGGHALFAATFRGSHAQARRRGAVAALKDIDTAHSVSEPPQGAPRRSLTFAVAFYHQDRSSCGAMLCCRFATRWSYVSLARATSTDGVELCNRGQNSRASSGHERLTEQFITLHHQLLRL